MSVLAVLVIGIFTVPMPMVTGSSVDLVTSIPSLTFTAPFTQYSGYLKINEQRSFHYWLVESEHAPTTDPLVLWLNGGPGCSSMDGLFTENGPYRIKKGSGEIYLHPQRWNKIANMLYLESPAGVGFSYTTTGNYSTDDDKVAADNYKALLSFYDKFPEYIGRELFVTGESYAGIYIPTLVIRIKENPDINLKGAAIGNGYMKPDLLEDTKFPYWYYHGMISSWQWTELTDACCKNTNHTDCQFIPFWNEKCQALVAKATVSIMKMAINPYNIYGPCEEMPEETTRNSRVTRLIALMLKQASRPFDDISVKNDFHALAAQVQHDPPCTDSTDLEAYMNRADVQIAIHVRQDLPRWTLCSNLVVMDGPPNTYTRLYNDMTPQFKDILKSKNIRMLVFNGDGDTTCNFFGDAQFVEGLDLPAVSYRRPWYYTSGHDGTKQIGGFAQRYEGITFVTIKGAGHMVPADQPISSFEMFDRFIHGAPI